MDACSNKPNRPQSTMPQSTMDPPSAGRLPRRYIYNDEDLQHFLASPSKRALLQFTAAMGQACVQSKVQFDPVNPLAGLSPAMACLHGALGVLVEWIRVDFPADGTKPQRFGNPVFREWHQRLKERSQAIVSAVLCVAKEHGPKQDSDASEEYGVDVLAQASDRGVRAASNSSVDVAIETEQEAIQPAVRELVCYLHDAFGHPIRLDYGTGHETSFQIFLFALCKLHCFGSTPKQPPSSDRLKAVTLSLYHQYLSVTRKLQMDYMLEPAGSHGVWGLDDHYCLPFYFGACQLQCPDDDDDDICRPRSIHNDSLLREKKDAWLYFGAIHFIKTLKRGAPFAESSPMLNDISRVESWTKVASGLLKLYEGEVLSKRQVVQHLVFGEICFPANWTPSQEEPLVAPTTVFRSNKTVASVNDPALGGRAPWADAPTRAPWAK